MRTFITWADGFVGHHLTRLLLEKGHSVTGTFFHKSPEKRQDRWEQCDIRNPVHVSNLFRSIAPDWIFHLAAYSSPAQSFHHGREVHETNFGGTFNLLDAMREHAPHSRVLIVGSAQCYGRVKESELPVTEEHPFNPYAVSKASSVKV